ncbi:unnamed protein product [Pieris macdunnoughi]|uniref:Uncharacterized protein n=1 Tax=Pieris macdunnoughi TaxID=345717 RepID=A0A821S6E9_9NEOP|nr:unnamed protein product [Pieris macdunnoughi]
MTRSSRFGIGLSLTDEKICQKYNIMQIGRTCKNTIPCRRRRAPRLCGSAGGHRAARPPANSYRERLPTGPAPLASAYLALISPPPIKTQYRTIQTNTATVPSIRLKAFCWRV